MIRSSITGEERMACPGLGWLRRGMGQARFSKCRVPHFFCKEETQWRRRVGHGAGLEDVLGRIPAGQGGIGRGEGELCETSAVARGSLRRLGSED